MINIFRFILFFGLAGNAFRSILIGGDIYTRYHSMIYDAICVGFLLIDERLKSQQGKEYN